jgi:alpha/beta hydrolase family protein
MVTFAQLRDADLDGLAEAVPAWTRLVHGLEQAEDAYRTRLMNPLRESGWKGADAEAAFKTLVPAQERIRVATAEASSIAGLLDAAHAKFTAAQHKLTEAIADATGAGILVGADGALRLPEMTDADQRDLDYRQWRVRMRQEMAALRERFEEAVREATAADTEIAGALAKLGPEIMDDPEAAVDLAADARLAAGLSGLDAGQVPPPWATTPTEIATWWHRLPEAQRHIMINAYPDKLGWANGLPTEDRDEANRARLASRLAELRAKQDPSDFEKRDLARLTKLDSVITAYEAKGRDIYLLGLDSTTAGPWDGYERDWKQNLADKLPFHLGDKLSDPTAGPDGKVIVAFGNPDAAAHTGVLVPGTTAQLDNVSGDLGRAANMYDASSAYAPGQISTIAWLDYDAPDNVVTDAPEGKYADAGGPRLNGFVDGLRAAQSAAGNTDAQLTAIGHSYGSTVVGEAARHAADRLAVDDIVVAGSPGVRVEHAGDLGIGADHVWAQEAKDDPVPSIGRYGHGAGGGLGDLPNVPSDDDFGGRRLATDGSGHSEYWVDRRPDGTVDGDPYTYAGPSVSLDQQARVISGAYADDDRAGDPILYAGGAAEHKDSWWQRWL